MDPILGQIVFFGFGWAPIGWLACQGQVLNIQQNSALFALIGAVYGGNGSSTFGLPDFQGRVPIGTGSGAGLQVYNLGDKGGVESVSLTTQQMPAHTHTASVTTNTISVTINASPVAGTETIPGTNNATTLAASSAGRTAGSFIYNNQSPTVALNTATAAVAGTIGVTNSLTGGNPVAMHENRQPYLAVCFAISTQGIFPSRP
jgi:microcystin-dependent protein